MDYTRKTYKCFQVLNISIEQISQQDPSIQKHKGSPSWASATSQRQRQLVSAGRRNQSSQSYRGMNMTDLINVLSRTDTGTFLMVARHQRYLLMPKTIKKDFYLVEYHNVFLFLSLECYGKSTGKFTDVCKNYCANHASYDKQNSEWCQWQTLKTRRYKYRWLCIE